MAQARAVGHVHLGPELADAAGHQVGVAVEILACLEGGELALVLAREDAQVLDLSLDDGLEHRPDAGLIRRGQGPEGGQALGQALEQGALGVERLGGGQRVGHRGEMSRVAVAERRAHRLEVRDARAAVDQPGVRDGVGGPRQEIREADGGAHRGGQDREREVKGPADPPEERGGEIRSRHGL